MKIVNTDNFNSDYPDESFVALPMVELNATEAHNICHTLNIELSGPMAARYYKVVNDNYVLSPGFEP